MNKSMNITLVFMLKFWLSKMICKFYDILYIHWKEKRNKKILTH
jgi:hypothetical protein